MNATATPAVKATIPYDASAAIVFGDQAKRMLAGATALALLLGLLAAWTITRQIIVPLRQSLAAAERVANGDLSQNDQPIERHDELGQLQASMQRMNQGLRTLISGIGDGVTQIASAAEELSAVTEQTSAGVNNQKVETDQVATAMNQMTATVHEVARSAESDDVLTVRLRALMRRKMLVDEARRAQAAEARAAAADELARANAELEAANRQLRDAQAQLVQSAEAYKEQTVAEARGQASRFTAVYEQYKNAPGVTRERLFLETMERVMGGTDKIILDSTGNGQGVVPYLPLEQLQRLPARGGQQQGATR